MKYSKEYIDSQKKRISVLEKENQILRTDLERKDKALDKLTKEFESYEKSFAERLEELSKQEELLNDLVADARDKSRQYQKDVELLIKRMTQNNKKG